MALTVIVTSIAVAPPAVLEGVIVTTAEPAALPVTTPVVVSKSM